MAMIYKVEGYVVDPGGDHSNMLEINETIRKYTDGYPFLFVEPRKFEWDDNHPINKVDASIFDYNETMYNGLEPCRSCNWHNPYKLFCMKTGEHLENGCVCDKQFADKT